jgi:hypothetical protein
MLGFDSPIVLVVVAFAFLLAGFVKGTIGMGLPTVAMGVLGVVMPPAQAASLLIVPSLATNVWQLAAGPAFGALVRRLRGMLLGVCLGVWATSGVLTGGNARLAAFALGVVLVVYACTGLASLQLPAPAHREAWLSPIVGAVTGAVLGATGIFVIPAVPYLHALGLEKEELIQALGLSFTVSTIALGLSLLGGGLLGGAAAGASLVALMVAIVGMFVGQRVRLRFSAATFRRCFFLGLLALGAYLAYRNSP